MIITSGRIRKRELQISIEDLIEILATVVLKKNYRLTGLNGDVVFHNGKSFDRKREEISMEIEQQC